MISRAALRTFLVLASTVSVASAQEVERPVPFDSASRILAVTSPLAGRLRLAAPAWPVTGDFVEARLYGRPNGEFVLVVQRTGGVFERYALQPAQRTALAAAIAEGSRATGTLTTGERADMVSEPAGGAFTRSQTVNAAIIWGPSVAALTSDGAPATALYLLTVGGTFFVAANLAHQGTITRAQNFAAADGGVRGAAIGSGLAFALAGRSAAGNTQAGAILAGSLVGTIGAFNWGRSFTDGEAHGAAWGSSFLTITTAGALGVAGTFHDEPRGPVLALVGAAITGYPLGLRWVRRAAYGITAGDVSALRTASLVGVLAAATFIGDGNPSDEKVAGLLTAGFLAGSVIGNRVLVRPVDHTESQGFQLGLGAFAGGLVGLVIPVATRAENSSVWFGMAAAGSLLGMAVTERLIAPQRAGARSGGAPAPGASSRASALRLRLYPENLALVLARSHGDARIPLGSLRF
jgi:hypothetical protein